MPNLPKDKVFIIIPAKNEQLQIAEVIRKTLDRGFTNIVVINDGSIDRTEEIACQYPNVTVLNHIINLGPGASTYTGIIYALKKNAKLIATIDADNQHDPKDLDALYSTICEQDIDIVIGSRFMKKNKIPTSRVFYNKIGNIISYFITGVYLSDSQSGIKIMTADFARNLSMRYNGFEFCIEMIKQAKINDARLKEIPINVRYTKASMQKGQNLVTGFSMVARLLKPF